MFAASGRVLLQNPLMAGTQTPREAAERAGCSPQAPLMLGRTYASIAHRRYLLRHHRHITQRGELDGTT